MKTILVTAYAVNPYKGSEDGMGWNFIAQIARFNKVIAVTRKNNAPHIEQYIIDNPGKKELFSNIRFIYFDWPYWLLFWKKGSLPSLIYFYMWQFTLAIWLMGKTLNVDIVHNLNFHNDWTPSFLWLLRKPLVWGPVGHHERIPKEFIKKVYGTKAFLKDRFLWVIKNFFWHFDPFLWITTRKAEKVLCMNSLPANKLILLPAQCKIVPSVAAENNGYTPVPKGNDFIVLSAGRFVPLKGFDLTIKAFALFYHRLPVREQVETKLILIGNGPLLSFLKGLIKKEKIEEAVQITGWLPREQLDTLYKKAHVFLFPSHEGAGMVVAEAMSYALPVVCLDNAGPGEFLPQHSQLSVPAGSYEDTCRQLSSKLERLYSIPSFYKAEQEMAFQRFNSYLSWEVRGEQLRVVYEQINSEKLHRHSKKLLSQLKKNYR